MIVAHMAIAARGVALPELDEGVRHRPAIFVEHPPGDDDAFALRLAVVLTREVVVAPVIGR